MNITLNFNEISQKFYHYHVQGKITSDINFFKTTKNLAILSFVISDNNSQKIECLAFGENASHLISKYDFKLGQTYQILNTKAILNGFNHSKTSHLFKLNLSSKTKIKQLKIKSYTIDDKLCVKFLNQKKKCHKKKETQEIERSHQLSIKNWFK